MVCCFWIGTPVYQQWYTKPTIITIGDTNYPVWHIHFPAITICSNIRIIKSKLTQEVQDIYGPGFINKYYYGTAEEKAECNEVIEDFSSMLKMYVLRSGEYEISEAQKAKKQNVTSVVQEYFSVNYTQIPGLLRMVPTIHFIG